MKKENPSGMKKKKKKNRRNVLSKHRMWKEIYTIITGLI